MGRTVARQGIIEKLGSGDRGVVYKPEDTHLDRFRPENAKLRCD